MHYAPGFRKTGIRTPEFLGTGLLDTTGVADVVPALVVPVFKTEVPDVVSAFVFPAGVEVTAGWLDIGCCVAGVEEGESGFFISGVEALAGLFPAGA